jgi:hypothetical protein
MKYQFLLIISVIVLVGILYLIYQSKDAAYQEVRIEELDKEIQDTINQIDEPNIYFIYDGKTIVLFSNLGKSGMYTFPSAEIYHKRDLLTVNIKSSMAHNDQFIKDTLLAKINMNKLPKEIKASYEGKPIHYKVIKLVNE